MSRLNPCTFREKYSKCTTIHIFQPTVRRKRVKNIIFLIELLAPNYFCLILSNMSIVQSRERIEEFTWLSHGPVSRVKSLLRQDFYYAYEIWPTKRPNLERKILVISNDLLGMLLYPASLDRHSKWLDTKLIQWKMQLTSGMTGWGCCYITQLL